MANKESIAKQEAPPDLALLLLPKEKWWWFAVRLTLYMLAVWTPWEILRLNAGLETNGSFNLILLMIYISVELYIRRHRERVRRLIRKAAGIYEEPAPPYRGPHMVWPLAVALPCLWSWWVAGALGYVDIFVILAILGWLLCWAAATLVTRVLSGRFRIGDNQIWSILACVVVAQVIAVATTKPVALKMESSIARTIVDLKKIEPRSPEHLASPPPASGRWPVLGQEIEPGG